MALSFGCLLLTTVSASAQTKQEVVKAWQQQTKSFQTLQLDYEASQYNLMDPFGEDAIFTLKHKFALSKDKYYSYLKFPNTSRDFTAMASAYNGDYYQMLMDEKGKVTVYKSRKENNSEQPYLSPNPLTMQYQFAFMPNTPHTIGTLKESKTWELLAERIREFRPSTRNGRQGFTVDIEIPQSNRIYRVFVEERTLCPQHWSIVNDSQDEIKVNEEVEEMDVNTFTSIKEKDEILKFPSQIIFRVLKNGRLVTQAHINTVSQSLKINEPVTDDIFTLAPQNATLVDADERARIFQEQQNYQESHPMGLAQPKVKIGDNAPNFNVKDANSKPLNLSAFKGKKAVVLTFFPKCFTGGCANHLSSLRDQQAEWDKNNVQIIAVSVDSADGEKGQKAFAEKWKLMFPLVPDTSRTVSKLYGAVQQDNELAARMTFLIDKAGIVRFIDTNVNVQTHGADVLAKLRELKIVP